MISVVLYGRNDSYGYNLHKRGALSLNCIAEVLDDPDDEILFVDWNTPDDFPTFPEAIADTLTERAKKVLRILRVRPALHARFAGRTHLVALEPPARNVAVRRANPANRWVLSTNTDMIFVPRKGQSLSAIAGGLADGYYHLPRFEVPETLWEGLDRRDPAGTIAAIGGWGRRFQLNEVVTLREPAVRYDGPGDFQLALRADLHDMHGFDERMLLGWHVDSNIAVRLGLRHGVPGDVVDAVFGYHCDHTRQVTPAHKAGAVQNDWRIFVRGLTEQRAPEQPDWGLADAAVEEVRLEEVRLGSGSGAGGGLYVTALEAAIEEPRAPPPQVEYGHGGHDRTEYDPDHIAPFVVDAVFSMPRDLVLAWVGSTPELLARFEVAWRTLGFTVPVRAAVAEADGTLPDGTAEMLDGAAVLVFDFAMPPALRRDQAGKMLDDPAIEAVAAEFRAAASAEHRRPEGAAARRFICVNAVANSIEGMVLERIGATTAPYSTRLRQGLVKPRIAGLRTRLEVEEELEKMLAEPAGEAEPSAVPQAVAGPAVPGLRRLMGLARRAAPAGWRRPLGEGFLLTIDAVKAIPGGSALGGSLVRLAPRVHAGLRRSYHLLHAEGLGLSASAVPVAPPPPPPPAEVLAAPPAGVNLLPALGLGPAGRMVGDGIAIDDATGGFVFIGPFLALPPGRYRARVEIEASSGGSRLQRERTRAVVDVVDGAVLLGVQTLAAGEDAQAEVVFAIGRQAAPTRVEVRLRKPAGMGGLVRRVTLERLAAGPG